MTNFQTMIEQHPSGANSMKRINGWGAALLVVTVAQFTGCGQKERIYELIPPADVQEIAGKYVKRVEILNDISMKRMDLQLDEVGKQLGPRKDDPQLAVPYSALLYDPAGKEWVYTSPEHRVFVRAQVKVDYIEGVESPEGRKMVAFLKDGPEIGTQVVRVGAEELYGTEKKIGHIDAYIRKTQGHK
jgi:predicted small lipoprotein YifL